MNNIRNPFFPGAGTPPKELAGRENILRLSEVLFMKVKNERPEKSLLLTGLRGVGKTVLLNKIRQIAQDDKIGYKVISFESLEEESFSSLLIPGMRKVFLELNRAAGSGDKVKKGFAVLKNFAKALKVSWGDFEVGFDTADGAADTGNILLDLPDLFVALGEAAAERKTPVAIVIDELQYLSEEEISALIISVHKIQQLQLPVVLVAAGLPNLITMVGESKSYTERLFNFQNVDVLSVEDTFKALQLPAQSEGAEFENCSIEEIYRMTKGYPYFIQEWGYQSWDLADRSPISLDVVKEASVLVISSLDLGFFRVRINRLTPKEKTYLRAMASLDRPYRSSEVAKAMGVKVSSVGTVRESLIRKGMIYSPVHGEMEFTVPLFDDFMRREMPQKGVE